MTRVQSPPVTVIIFSSFNITQCDAVVFLFECETETHSSAQKEGERERKEAKREREERKISQVTLMVKYHAVVQDTDR